MPVYFQKPENALKRANEFVDVGKKEAALDILYDVIKSKKHRTWQKIHEPILQKYLSLCVDLKRSVNAKEGLYQYKLICQQVNIFSLEEVISFFLKLADEMADGARNQSIELVAVEDLDMVQTPEGIMLSSVSSEDAQDRSDRLLLTPWVKFLWEAYRNVLELLRNNNRLERLYHDTAQNAFKFCLKYKRRAEFRKLCNLIKNHLDQVLKYQTQPTSVNLNAPESLQMNLETRLFQLESAISMELWQEAFRAIEGIHYLMQLSKKPPKPHMMANYYEKVALVFLKAGNFLFHGAALLKLFVLTKEHKKSATQDELQSLSNRVVLAMLSIAVTPGQSAMEAHLNYNASQYEKEMKLTQLIGLLQVPTRKSCAKELSIVLPHASEDVVALHAALEEQFQPTRLCKKVDEILTRLSENEKMKQYVSSVQKTAIVRMLKQVSQLYETMHFEKLLSLIPFADQFMLQRAIVEGVKNGTVQASLDHRTKAVTFGSALVVAMKEEVPEGPHIQAMPSEILRNQLISLSEGLSAVMPLMMGGALEREGASQREQVVQQYLRAERKEHQQILNRKSTIEARKEKIESLKHEQERFERDKINKQAEKLKAAEETRLDEEREKREKDRRVAEMKEIQKQQVWDRVALLRETDTGKKAFKHLTQEEIDEMDPEDILVKQAEQMDREKRDLTVKLKTQEKKVDFFVRACRLVEIPKLQTHQDDLGVHDRTVWEEEERKRIEATETEHHVAVSMKERLSVMQDDKQAFLDKLFGNRHAEYEVRLTEFDAMVDEAREERLAERRKQRMARRREEFILKQREEKQKLREEIQKKEEEIERRRQEAEAEERKRKEEEEEAKREELELKKQEREREIEEKMKQREAERLQERLQERENMMRGGSGGGGGQEDGKRGDDREPSQDWRGGGSTGSTGGGGSGGGGGGGDSGGGSAPPAGGGSRYVPPSMRQRQMQSDTPKEPERKADPEPESGAWRRGGGGGDDRRQDDGGGGDRRMEDRGGGGGGRQHDGGGGGDGNRWNRGGDGPPSGRAAFGDRSGGERSSGGGERSGGGGAFGDRFGGGDRGGGDRGGGDRGGGDRGGDSGGGPWNRNREGGGDRPAWGGGGGGDRSGGGDSAGSSGPWGGNRNKEGGSAWGNRDGGGGGAAGGGGAWGNRDGGNRDGGRGEGRSYQASRVSRD